MKYCDNGEHYPFGKYCPNGSFIPEGIIGSDSILDCLPCVEGKYCKAGR